jgi:hypothetical protein
MGRWSASRGIKDTGESRGSPAEETAKGHSGFQWVRRRDPGNPRIMGVREDTCREIQDLGVTIQVVLCEYDHLVIFRSSQISERMPRLVPTSFEDSPRSFAMYFDLK